MDQKILNFLSINKIGVVSVQLEDGTIHSATVHYSHADAPLKFYIQTSNNTLKARPFLEGKAGNGAMVIGFSTEEWITCQMHGTIRAVFEPNELQAIYSVHYQKHPETEQYRGPKTVFLEFTPTWYRYTDFNTEPRAMLEGKL